MLDESFINKPHVLIVDDNLINQVLATKILNRLEVSVTCANNGKEAMDLLSINSYDLVLMDISMPIMDGLEATNKIRRIEAFDKIPIIAFTAYSKHEYEQECLNIGMNAFLPKPITMSSLKEAVFAFVKKS